MGIENAEARKNAEVPEGGIQGHVADIPLELLDYVGLPPTPIQRVEEEITVEESRQRVHWISETNDHAIS